MAADLPVPTYTNLNEAYPDLVTAAREAYFHIPYLSYSPRLSIRLLPVPVSTI
ncbi:hypothetical protein PHLCEN_2v7079 [Hermanssonia centrifuga]|uniref:Uncharacterized protein n=1 Tax=Hermanssonia centrifuga TaxID=98765 RepID=A0A2R6NXK6_9APHY|nr:hypothetical protein PHLCEN_2v7079 [Hermanssonia centrifuga]